MRSAKPFLIAASLLMALRLLLHAYLSRYAVPVADDLCYAYKAPGTPLLDWLLNEYRHWNGRYLSNVFVGRGPLLWGSGGLLIYRLMPAFWLLLTVAVNHALLRTLLPRLQRSHTLLLAATFTLLFLDAMPAIGQGIHWYTGAVTYQLGNVLLLAYLIALIRSNLYTAFALLALAMGMNETHMLLALLFTAGAFMLLPRMRKAISALLLLAITCALVVIMAPGNAERSAFFPENHRLVHSLGMTALQTARFLGSWISSPALLTASIAFVVCHGRFRSLMPAPKHHLLRDPLFIGGTILVVIAACVFPAYWSMGMLAQHRTLNVACFLFVPLWAWWLHITLERVYENGSSRGPFPHSFAPIAIAVALIALLITGNGWHALRDLSTGRAARYAQAWHLRHAPGAMECPPLIMADPPRTLAVFPTDKPEQQWILDCECGYFRQRSERSTETHETLRESFPR